MADEKWLGRSAAEILDDGVGSPAQVYCWRRARGESKEAALAEIIRASGYSSEVNIAHLTTAVPSRGGARAGEGGGAEAAAEDVPCGGAQLCGASPVAAEAVPT